MIELKGKYNTAKVFTDSVEESAQAQILNLCNLEAYKESRIRMMPDVHAGVGCTVGTTMTIHGKLTPNLIGVDINCGMYVACLNCTDIDLKKLDALIHEKIPVSYKHRDSRHPYSHEMKFRDVVAEFDLSNAQYGLGSLGGGNHFIEVDRDDDGLLYIVVHSGSRNFGYRVAKWHQDLAIKRFKERHDSEINEVIERLKSEGRQSEISDELKSIPKLIPEDLMYLEGKDFDNYINDMRICEMYAHLSRKAMMDIILEGMEIESRVTEEFETLHNYVDLDKMILRKGSIALYEDQKAIIPMNMRDGSLIVIGKGNEDWNFSGPHGAGRIMSRKQAKETLDMDKYKKSMEGIYTTCVDRSTIDEAPDAYKPMEAITSNIGDTCDIIKVIKPIYNFKAAES